MQRSRLFRATESFGGLGLLRFALSMASICCKSDSLDAFRRATAGPGSAASMVMRGSSDRLPVDRRADYRDRPLLIVD